MTTEQCRTCHFWQPWNLVPGVRQLGECRCYAPRSHPHAFIDDENVGKYRACWPVTDATDWCGDYVPRSTTPRPKPQARVQRLMNPERPS